MKGIIFASFIDFAEKQLGTDFVDEMLDEVTLSTGGAYTIVGTYPTTELLDMIGFILSHHELDQNPMLQSFGQHTFKFLADNYPKLVSDFSDSFDCIFHVDQTIHKNVLKLYPDAELPTLNAQLSDNKNQLHLVYNSTRPFMHIAHGLVLGCINYYGDDVGVKMTDLSDGKNNHAEFFLTRNA